MSVLNKGLVHLYYGDGKGKTSAAVGLGVRAGGIGKRILFVQFLKDNDSGEIKALEGNDAFKILKDNPVTKFVFAMDEREKAEVFKRQNQHFKSAVHELVTNKYDVIILDEVIDIVNFEIISLDDLKELIRIKPSHSEVVMTGHQPQKEIIELCDYVSEIKKIKHPYDKGVKGRIGIEK